MGSISINPMVTTGASEAFNISSDGYVQGTFLDDPAVRYQLEGGYVDTATVDVIWGGLPLTLAVPNIGAAALGPSCSIADSAAVIDAWSLFNQAAAMVVTPSSQVPTATSGMSINFARAGSNMRIALPVAAAAISGLQGAEPNVALYWDFTNNNLATSGTGILPVQLEFLSTTSKIVVWDGTNATWNYAGPCAIVRI